MKTYPCDQSPTEGHGNDGSQRKVIKAMSLEKSSINKSNHLTQTNNAHCHCEENEEAKSSIEIKVQFYFC